jgi:hypothetical protein
LKQIADFAHRHSEGGPRPPPFFDCREDRVRRVGQGSGGGGQRGDGRQGGGGAGHEGAAVHRMHGFLLVGVMTRQGGKPHGFMIFGESVISSPPMAVGGKSPPGVDALGGGAQDATAGESRQAVGTRVKNQRSLRRRRCEQKGAAVIRQRLNLTR